MLITKAPILYTNAMSKQICTDQRDADHSYYLKEFVRWLDDLKDRCDYLMPLEINLIESIRKALLKDAGETK